MRNFAQWDTTFLLPNDLTPLKLGKMFGRNRLVSMASAKVHYRESFVVVKVWWGLEVRGRGCDVARSSVATPNVRLLLLTRNIFRKWSPVLWGYTVSLTPEYNRGVREGRNFFLTELSNKVGELGENRDLSIVRRWIMELRKEEVRTS